MKQRTGKMTRKAVEEFASNSVPIINITYLYSRFPETSAWLRNTLDQHTISKLWSPGKGFKELLGLPLVRMDYESSPGVWIFEGDCVHVVVFSDIYKKNPWKGTSFELVISDAATDQDVLEAVKWLYDFIPDNEFCVSN